MSDSARSLFDDAMSQVELECPAAFAAVRSALGRNRVLLELPQDSIAFEFDPRPDQREPTIRIRTQVAAVRNLVVGDLDLMDALGCDQLELIGTPRDLCDCGDAMLFLLKGIVRCTAADTLLVRLEQLAKDEEPL